MYKALKNFSKMLETTLLPYKPFLDKGGISITSYEDINKELNYIIIGVKIVFPNTQMLEKFVSGGK